MYSPAYCHRCHKTTQYPPIKIPEKTIAEEKNGVYTVVYNLYCLSCARKVLGWWGQFTKWVRAGQLTIGEYYG